MPRPILSFGLIVKRDLHLQVNPDQGSPDRNEIRPPKNAGQRYGVHGGVNGASSAGDDRRKLKGPKIWDAWFDPYFRFIHRHKNVKAFCYINQDWDSIGTWKGWGDSRLSQNAEIRKKFQEQIGAAMFLHGADREQTLKALRVKE